MSIADVCKASIAYCRRLEAGHSPSLEERGIRNIVAPCASDVTTNSDRVNAYIREVLEETGKKISRKDLWAGKAGYDDPTEFQRWQRNDPHTNATARRIFEDILKKKPHLT